VGLVGALLGRPAVAPKTPPKVVTLLVRAALSRPADGAATGDDPVVVDNRSSGGGRRPQRNPCRHCCIRGDRVLAARLLV
jgi:hypothetical protein